MVVARRATRGEGVAQPEGVLLGDGVGEVGEGCRALVGCNDKVGVVAVVTDDVGRRHHDPFDEIVGDVEHASDECGVGSTPLVHPRVAIDLRVRERLGQEPALGAHRHDDSVLDLLRLHQAKDLGAEVRATIAPAQPAACDAAEAQVDTLDARGIDPDLEAWPRQWQLGDELGIQLDRQPIEGLALGIVPVGIGAQRGYDHAEQGAQDAILVQAHHVVECLTRARSQGVLPVAPPVLFTRVEPCLEDLDEELGDRAIAQKRRLDEVLPQARTRLLEVADVAAQDDDLLPGECRAHREAVEGIRLAPAVPNRKECRFESPPQVVPVRDIALGQLEAEVVHMQGHPAHTLNVVGMLVFDDDTEGSEHRQDPGERDGVTRPDDLEATQPRLMSLGGVKA